MNKPGLNTLFVQLYFGCRTFDTAKSETAYPHEPEIEGERRSCSKTGHVEVDGGKISLGVWHHPTAAMSILLIPGCRLQRTCFDKGGRKEIKME